MDPWWLLFGALGFEKCACLCKCVCVWRRTYDLIRNIGSRNGGERRHIHTAKGRMHKHVLLLSPTCEEKEECRA